MSKTRTAIIAASITAAATYAAITGVIPQVFGNAYDAVAAASPVVGAAITADDGGYLAFQANGGVIANGDAVNDGSLPSLGVVPTHPVVGGAADPTGGYWEVATDGGVFSFGAPFYGSTGGIVLNKPIVGMTSTPDGGGYLFVASDGGVFAFGDAGFYGSLGGMNLVAPIVGIAATPDGHGYWLVDTAGHVYSFGDAPYEGGGTVPAGDVAVGISANYLGTGYTIATRGGVVSYLGSDGPDASDNPRTAANHLGTVAVVSAADAGILTVDTNGTAYDSTGTTWATSVGSTGDYQLAYPLKPDGTPVRWGCSSYPITVSYNANGAPVTPNVAADIAKVSKAMGVPFKLIAVGPVEADIQISWAASLGVAGSADFGLTYFTTTGYANQQDLSQINIALSATMGANPKMATDVLLHELGHEGLYDEDKPGVTNEEELPSASSTGAMLGRFGAGDLAGLHLVGNGSVCS